ncbi:Protein with similarity to Chediak-Higashi syndrome and Beige proteins [Komagataella phaffii CBS 7435]|uniref:Protein with similarity to Chediak-Higashi syndrome and Beige proteins n=1 Tax=Komagataella phaffii (strain ATCC 76273 / CBS 7435 / CECT 11047 / NRRL Y-11430 / Wegner 21-1) TaxID=981350 RepID=F2QVX9_KOMPC|nr:GQ67_03682T0 [Komagataella phaffii]AOA68661.1 GQ68_03654T0 [Komagataella phaffii GS115]CAH2449578.1 Protein with similarity to Chediak-Higashi syndrome and Beige proteins [Komagataella phaffii CBS 7435]CCA39557.1 Protein with similarity to Chediak-Higashi syndrome and Beige proteins [Komagataella phaffii CBS 7435]
MSWCDQLADIIDRKRDQDAFHVAQLIIKSAQFEENRLLTLLVLYRRSVSQVEELAESLDTLALSDSNVLPNINDDSNSGATCLSREQASLFAVLLHLILIQDWTGDDARFPTMILQYTYNLMHNYPINKVLICSESLNRQFRRARRDDIPSHLLDDCLIESTDSDIDMKWVSQYHKDVIFSNKDSSLLLKYLKRDQLPQLVLPMESQISVNELSLENPNHGFTFQAWISISDGRTNITSILGAESISLFQISTADRELFQIGLVGERLFIKPRNDDDCIFESFVFELNKLYHITIVNQGDNKGRPTKAELYVDGDFAQTIYIPNLFHHPPDSFQLTISNIETFRTISLSSLLLINNVQPYEWIQLSYWLGPKYAGFFQDRQVTKLLSLRNRAFFEIKLRKYYNQDRLKVTKLHENGSKKTNNLIHLATKRGLFKLPPNSIILAIHSTTIFKVGDRMFAPKTCSTNQLTDGDIPDENWTLSSNGACLLYQPSSIHKLVYAVGGGLMLLRFVESSSTEEQLIYNLSILFEILESSWLYNYEFTIKNGYDILATILKTKRNMIGIKTLDSVLHFVGYDHQSPFKSILVNVQAYKSLIVDFEIWKSSKNNNESFKFLLFQFTVFGQDSKYHDFNIKQLSKMKIIKRFIQALKFGSFESSILPILHNSLLVLIKANPAADILRALSLYVVYSLNNNLSSSQKLIQRSAGACVLDALTTVVCDTSTSATSLDPPLFYRRVVKSLSVKWALLILTDEEIKVSINALKILIRLFTMLRVTQYEKFISHAGLDILTSFLQSKSYDNELISTIFCGTFGFPQTRDFGSNLRDIVNNLAPKGTKLRISMPEFLFLLANLFKASAIKTIETLSRDLSASTSMQSLNFLAFANSFIYMIVTTYGKPSSLESFFLNDKKWLAMLLNILLLFELSTEFKAIPEMDEIRISIEKLLSEIFIKKIFDKKATAFSSFMGSVTADSRTFTIVHAFIFPHVLEHLEEFCIYLQELTTKPSSTLTNVFRFYESCLNEERFSKWTGPQAITFIESSSNYLEIFRLHCDDKGRWKNDLQNIGDSLCSLLIRELLQATVSLMESNNQDSQSNIKRIATNFIFHQELYLLKTMLDNEKLATFCVILFKNIFINDPEISNLCINCLKTCFLVRQPDFEHIAELIADDAGVVIHFFTGMLSITDDELRSEASVPSVRTAFLKNFTLKMNILKHLNNSTPDSTSTLLKLVDKSVLQKRSAVESFKSECSYWTKIIVSSELAKYHRHNQDHRDDVLYYINMYNKLKIRTSVSLKVGNIKPVMMLDLSEGMDRMRKRILPDYNSLAKKLNTDYAKTSGDDKTELVKEDTPDIKNFDDTDSISSQDGETFEFVEEPGDIEAQQEDKNRKVLRSLNPGDKVNAIWNVCQVHGLEATESVMILGASHIYLIENYYHSPKGEIIDIEDADLEDRDPYMQLLTGQKRPDNFEKDLKSHSTTNWKLNILASVSKRQFLFRDVGLELFFADGSSFLITCISPSVRDYIHFKLKGYTTQLLDQDLSQAFSLAATSTAHLDNNSFTFKLTSAFSGTNLNNLTITKKWRRGEISNFYYLMIVNTLAGRTYKDLTQYPVFPWVLSDYTSDTLDLDDPKVYRDLTKPMGAQTEKRLNLFKERYEALQSLEDSNAPPFHYGTHYSSSMIVTSFLIRLEPFVQSYLLLQGGKFDHADRMFYSINKAWNSSSADNTSDVRELIPEFFYLPEFLMNSNKFDLGTLQSGSKVDNVELPPWAKGDPKLFIEKNREALESPYVSAHLHEWIDLVFGFKQRGKPAVEAFNVFHHLSYSGAVDLDKIEEEVEKKAMTGIIHNFGQTPLQVFTKPHPPRDLRENIHISRADLEALDNGLVSQLKRIKPIKCIVKTNLQNSRKFIGYPTSVCSDRLHYVMPLPRNGSLLINEEIVEGLQNDSITCLVMVGDSSIAVGDVSGVIHIWKIVSTDFSKTLEPLELKEVLRGHESAIKDLKVSQIFNTLISLDEEGNCFMWDLLKFEYMRSICEELPVSLIDIDNHAGFVGCLSGNELLLYTINGESISSSLIGSGNVGSISFARRNDDLFNLEGQINHEYWIPGCVLAVGFVSEAKLYGLFHTENRYDIRLLKTISMDEANKICCIRFGLSSEYKENTRLHTKPKLLCGDDEGRLFVVEQI